MRGGINEGVSKRCEKKEKEKKGKSSQGTVRIARQDGRPTRQDSPSGW
jgi:hypothetical protein